MAILKANYFDYLLSKSFRIVRQKKNMVRWRLIRSYVTPVISISRQLTLMGAAAIFWARESDVICALTEL